MLVLTRQREQTIMIGDEIEITVVDIRGDKVRLGITAPKQVPVHRKEVYNDIHGIPGTASSHLPDTAPVKSPGGVVSRPALSVPVSPAVSAGSTGPADKTNGSTQPHPSLKSADPFLQAAIEEAQAGLREGGLPIGSVLVRDGRIIAAGHNRRVQHNNPMAHAEIDCLTRAGRQKTYRDTVLYSTLFPCYLCSGAVVQFGIPKVVVGDSVNFPGGVDFLRRQGVEVVDLHDEQCIRMMSDFIRDHPKLWNEDIGR